ncbi:MAG: agmatinase [Thermoplasmatota archaeon]
MSLKTHFEDRSRFLCADDSYETADVTLFGVPYDGAASLYPGARQGPSAIRQASWGLEPYSPTLQRSLLQPEICDLRDLPVYGTQQEIFHNVRQVARQAAADATPFLAFGGDHSVTYPLVAGAHDAVDDLTLLVFDAHLDLRDEYLGNPLSHACVVRRCLEITPDVHHFGGRSGVEAEWSHGQVRRHHELLPEAVVDELQSSDAPLYVSIDIDVLDPAYAPGVGTPEPGGCTTRELISAIHRLRPLRHRLISCDIMEVTPGQDPAGITASAAALVARELLLSMAP